LPVLLVKSAVAPIAVLPVPDEFVWNASSPRAVLVLSQIWGHCALASRESASHAKAMASALRRKPSREGEQFIGFLNGRVVVFICAEDCKNLALLSIKDSEQSTATHCGAAEMEGWLVEPLHLFSQNMNTNRPFQFDKRSQLFISAHDETLSIAAMCVHNPDA
jgi:hypothetical protein